MSPIFAGYSSEMLLSQHSDKQWRRREQELSNWLDRPKQRKQVKRTLKFNLEHVDAELHPTLKLLQHKEIRSEYSCAGVSPLDEPLDHSLYAYITIYDSPQARRWVDFVMKVMKHRLLVTFESERSRYDLSSFFMSHNRSFCLLMQHCAEHFQPVINSQFHNYRQGTIQHYDTK